MREAGGGDMAERERQERLREAAALGDAEEVRRLVELGVGLNSQNEVNGCLRRRGLSEHKTSGFTCSCLSRNIYYELKLENDFLFQAGNLLHTNTWDLASRSDPPEDTKAKAVLQ